MSKPTRVTVNQIPMGILVSVSSKTCKLKKPTPKQKKLSPTRMRRVPWMWILMFAYLGLVASIVGISLLPAKQHAVAPLIAETSLEPPAAPFVQEKTMAIPIAVEAEFGPERAPVRKILGSPLRDVPVVRSYSAATALPLDPVMIESIFTPDKEPRVPNAAKRSVPALRQVLDSHIHVSCTQIGTNVLFMKDPPEAFQRAKSEKKLVFVLHLSGNFEDKGFT